MSLVQCNVLERRTNNMEVGVEQDGAMLIGGLALIHRRVTQQDIREPQHAARHPAASVLVHH